MNLEPSPCQSCGACCAHYRVSFYWQEAAQRGLDEGTLLQVSPWQVCFRGTEAKPVRCVNLDGEVGSCVSCRIYEQRTTPCRSVVMGDEKCLQARAAHGMGGIGVKGGFTLASSFLEWPQDTSHQHQASPEAR